jgi:hypothetical protein
MEHTLWHNTEGIRVTVGDAGSNVTAYRGAKASLSASSAPLTFKFELLLTPSVSLNTTAHFGDQGRYLLLVNQPTPLATNPIGIQPLERYPTRWKPRSIFAHS